VVTGKALVAEAPVAVVTDPAAVTGKVVATGPVVAVADSAVLQELVAVTGPVAAVVTDPAAAVPDPNQ
jgi:autotransporter adhesin